MNIQNLNFEQKVEQIKGKYINRKESMNLDQMLDLYEKNEKH